VFEISNDELPAGWLDAPFPDVGRSGQNPRRESGVLFIFRCQADLSAARRIESRAALVNSAGLLASLNLLIVKLIIKTVAHRARLDHVDVTVRLSTDLVG
jgi:hypothetical protein